MAEPQPVPALWLTSRSAFERGTQHCAFNRFLEYHAGPYGHGFQSRALSVPLATGSYLHEPLTAVLAEAMRLNNQMPSDEFCRGAIRDAVDRYYRIIDQRGLFQLPDEAAKIAVEETAVEQATLIEGLFWAWMVYRLPVILAEETIVMVEQEEVYVIGCTCGVGDGLAEWTDHRAKDCAGVGLQTRADFVTRVHLTGNYRQREFKTAATGRKNWQEMFEHKVQLISSIVGAERKLDAEVTDVVIEGLIKAKRDREKDETGMYNGPKRQQSFLCYAYYKPANPPLSPDVDWQAKFRYVDGGGKNRTLQGKGYTKVPLWPQPADLDADGNDLRFPGKPIEMTSIEYWVKILPPECFEPVVRTVGPIPKQRAMVDAALRSYVAEETLWQDRLWRVYEWATANPDYGWETPEFQAMLETIIPRSWDCHPFADHPCGFIPICHKHEGWQDPVGSGRFVYRAPHHVPEAQQMRERGLEPPSEGIGVDPDELDQEEA